MARRGIKFETPKRKVTIYELKLHDGIFTVKCSSGTYVRSIVTSIAGHITVYPDSYSPLYFAAAKTIRRTKNYGFSIKDSVTLDFLENLYNNDPAYAQGYLMSVDFGLDDILVHNLDAHDSNLFKNGGFITVMDGQDEMRRVYSDGQFIGIGMLENGMLYPKRIIIT